MAIGEEERLVYLNDKNALHRIRRSILKFLEPLITSTDVSE